MTESHIPGNKVSSKCFNLGISVANMNGKAFPHADLNVSMLLRGHDTKIVSLTDGTKYGILGEKMYFSSFYLLTGKCNIFMCVCSVLSDSLQPHRLYPGASQVALVVKNLSANAAKL